MNEVQISIRSFLILEFILTEYSKELNENLSPENIEFKFNFKLNLDDQKDILNLTCEVLINELHGNKNDLGSLTVINSFNVINLRSIIVENKIPNDLINILTSVSIGTLRGILLLKLENTKISNAIIPIIDPNNFLPATETM